MALVVYQPQNQKHYCKICKKGFACGRALGGHMRAHGIGSESGEIDEDDEASDWEDRVGGAEVSADCGSKHMYELRTNPNRMRSCRACENCGEEFFSWKAFLEHGKCEGYEEIESPVSYPLSDGEGGPAYRSCRWSKRKRSVRAQVGFNRINCASSEEEDLVNCLMMLSNANAQPLLAEPEESCGSASREDERKNTVSFLALAPTRTKQEYEKRLVAENKGTFECKACKKVFNSHQALGGHRASHKKVKGCFAADDNFFIINHDFIPSKVSLLPPPPSSKRKSKIHECSICHKVFSSGQALGGHKRCHWITSNNCLETSSFPKFHRHHLENQAERSQRKNNQATTSDPSDFTFDLNIPIPDDDQRGNPSSLNDSTQMTLFQFIGEVERENLFRPDELHDDQQETMKNDFNFSGYLRKVNEEDDRKIVLATLCQLKDMDGSGSSSQWLQIGNGSALGVVADQQLQ